MHLCGAICPGCPAGLRSRQARGTQPRRASTCARQLALPTPQPQPAALLLRVLLSILLGALGQVLAPGQQAELRICGPSGHAPSDTGAAQGRQGTRFGAQHTCGCVWAYGVSSGRPGRRRHSLSKFRNGHIHMLQLPTHGLPEQATNEAYGSLAIVSAAFKQGGLDLCGSAHLSSCQLGPAHLAEPQYAQLGLTLCHGHP